MLELKNRKLQPCILQKASKNKVITEIMTSNDVKLQWCIIAPQLKDERASQELLKLITELWINYQTFLSSRNLSGILQPMYQIIYEKGNRTTEGIKTETCSIGRKLIML